MIFDADIPGEPKVYRFRCDCGCVFYMAISTKIPGLFAIHETMEKAIRKLEVVAGIQRRMTFPDLEIPDSLPEDF